jgi:hypothetical protein
LLPSKITLYCKPKGEDGVHHAFPVDSAANHDTAQRWAQGGRWGDEKQQPVVYEFDNSNFDNVVINSLDIRGEGGRAYQVIVERDNTKFRVDLREDTLMDVIRNTGIQAGGKLNGTFCFVKESSQTKLIREGTAKYEWAKAKSEKQATYTKNIKKSELKPGYMYSTLSGDKKIFLGHVYSRNIDKETGFIDKPHKAMLFYDSSELTPESIEFLKTGSFKIGKGSGFYYWSYKVMKSHSLRIEGEKKIDVDLETFVDSVNKMGQELFDDKMKEKHKGSYWIDSALDCYELAHVKVDKEDLDFNDSDSAAIIRANNNRNNYRGW